MKTAPARPDDLDRPLVKYRLLKRCAWSLGLLLTLAALRGGWGLYAHRQLQAEIARIQAAGEPILLEDFEPAVVPDADNAAIPLTEAATIAAWLGDGLDQVGDARFFEAHARIKSLILDARSRGACAWPALRRAGSATDVDPLYISYDGQPEVYWRLGHFLAEAAKRRRHAGNDAAAVEAIGDMLLVARRLEAPPAFALASAIAAGVRARATRSIEDLLPGLQVADGESGTHPAARDQIESLIGELLDEGPTVAYLATALRAARMPPAQVGLAASKRWSVGPDRLWMPWESVALERAAGFALKPAFVLDCVRAMRKADKIARASMAASFPDAEAALQEPPRDLSGQNRTNEFYSSLLASGLRRELDRRFRASARNRMAATALAMRLYELDHGRPPAKLDDLVPDYLTELPADPFAADGRPITYEPEAVAQSSTSYSPATGQVTTAPPGPPHAVLYSVGPDGRDGRGSSHVSAAEDARDIVFHLDGYRPAPVSPWSAAGMGGPASPKAQEKNDEAADQEGDADEDQDAEQKPTGR